MAFRIQNTVVWIGLLSSLNTFAVTPFGVAGRNGRDGIPGRTGRDGFSTSVYANGQAVRLNLDAENGSDGRDGEPGEGATNCNQPTPADNVFGAAGGSGGAGGTAGNGGSGGNLTVYFNDLSDLRNIYVSSRPGQGGRAGREGRGGKGCYCKTPSWTAYTCHSVQKPDGTAENICEDTPFSCIDGTFGHDGNHPPSFGQMGSPGRLTLIHGTNDPQADNPSVTAKLPNWLGRTSLLTRNVWSTQNGATQLLAPGSIISDTYRLYTEQKQMSVSLNWEMTRPVTDFADVTVSATLNASGTDVDLSLPESIWYRFEEDRQAPDTLFTFKHMLRANEVNRLAVELSGTASNLVATVTDSTDSSDVLATSFDAEFGIPGFFGGTTLFKGKVPADLIERNGRIFKIAISKLPGLKTEKMKPGTKLDLYLTANRALDSFHQEVSLRTRFRLPNTR
jgi:hypothetical protein